MRYLTLTIAFFIILNNIFSQCPPYWYSCSSDAFPSDVGMYDIHLCHQGFGAKATPSKQSTIHKKVIFHFPPVTVFLEGEPVWIEFGEGNLMHVDASPVEVNFSSTGLKEVFLYEGSSNSGPKEKIFEITVKEGEVPYQSPDLIWPLAGGQAYVSFAEGRTELLKPVIFVEGLDFGNGVLRDPNKQNKVIRYGANGWDVLSTGVSELLLSGENDEELFQNVPAQFANFKQAKTIDGITEAGFDVIVLDFEDGAGDLIENAQVLKALLNKVDSEKQTDANGIRHQNVVIGTSMGGIIARIALAEMEQEGLCHDASTYVSFDAPHKGANVSLGLQALLWYNATFFAEDAIPRDIKMALEFWNNLKRPAPQQLLTQNLLGAYQQGAIDFFINRHNNDGNNISVFEDHEDMTIDYTSAHQSLMNYLDEIGYPKQTRNIAIVNGNGNGQNIGISAGHRLLDADHYEAKHPVTEMVFRAHIWALNGASYSQNDFGANFSSNNCIFYAKRPVGAWNVGPPIPDSYVMVGVEMTQNLPTYDNAPGSVREDIKNLIVPALNCVEDLDQNPVNYSYPNVTFVPTISALDVDTEDLFFNISTGSIIENDLTPFEAIYLPSNFEPHAKTNGGNRDWIEDQLQLNRPDLALYGVLPNPKGTTYNYGFYRKKVPTLSINDGGYLYINNEGLTGHLNQPDSNEEVFNAFTSGCDGGEITVNSGGHFIIGKTGGSVVRKGNMHFTYNTRLNMESGSETVIETQSRLIFQEESKAYLESGALLNAKFGAQIIIESGATLHVKSGGILRIMHWSDLIVEEGGQLIIDEGAIIQLWDSNPSGDGNANIQIYGKLVLNGSFDFGGQGYFTFHDSHQLEFGEGVDEFTLNGHGKGHRFIRINDSQLDFGDRTLRLSNGKVEYVGSSSLTVYDGGKALLQNMEFGGINNVLSSNGLITSGTEKVNINNCDFYNLNRAIYCNGLNNPTGTYVLYDSKINNCKQGAWVWGMNSFNFFNVDFNGGPESSYAIDARKINNCYVSHGKINNYNSSSIIGAVILNNVTNFQVRYGELSNNIVGISVPDGSQSNVFLNRGTRIIGNGIGVDMVKGGLNGATGEDYGLVHVDCARFIDNGMAIQGEDVLLEIDAIENCLGCLPNSSRPNQFEGDKLFSICYQDRDITEISAQRNYWGGEINAPFPEQFRIRNGLCNSSFNNVVLDASNPSLFEPSGNCGGGQSIGNIAPIKICVLTMGNTNYLLHQQFKEAYKTFRLDSLDLSRNKFKPIAAIPDQIRNQSSVVCKQYIDVARVMTSIKSNPKSKSTKSGYRSGEDYAHLWSPNAIAPAVGKYPTTFNIYPNPATDHLILDLEDGDQEIRFIDPLGRIQYSGMANGRTMMEVKNWPSGLYLIEAIDIATKQRKTARVIIQNNQ